MPARLTGFLLLLVTAIGWALNWPAMKILLREWPPLFSRGVAGVAAAILLGVIATSVGENIRVPREWMPRLLLASATNVFAWMGFSTLSMKWLSVSEGALLVYTMPIWSMLLAWPIAKRKPSTAGFGALALGLAGVVVLLSAHGFDFDSDKFAGIAFALSAAVLFALGTVITHTPMPIPPISLVAWQVGIGCMPMVLLGWFIEHPSFSALHADGWAVLIYMSLVPMAVCYLAWFATLRRLPADIASIGMLLVPIMGIVAAALSLGEPLGMREAVDAFGCRHRDASKTSGIKLKSGGNIYTRP
ncbi:Permease of the drug/metabolite transporter (DMT) superfamily [Candidatus Burkholderia verschuerenii]|uniref:Permease of the drug/metabolite transporter (DMT) superfamily n=1 Tax=Candidatus Burkholderia verschuerenii TaxID=242163 RepID=A0A0L0MFQ4_9BURK|nr:DMT family transporter [Candidatus Burkholderia verschuerenii]KND61153.1 Permease of the drug/metabolite transporter (DMT) superfamily [Candidatus Burkholderia verschuerenii]